VNPPTNGADAPPAVVITTFMAPAVETPVVAVIEVALFTVTFVAAAVPIVTVAPVTKLVPVMETTVPPLIGPELGVIAVTVGMAR
jgi:hypothetical protein